MGLGTRQIGWTGESANIGGSSSYHIDTKILRSLPIDQQVAVMDTLAARYAQDGRYIEFSNSDVSGLRWNLNATPQEKALLLHKVDAAHSHNRNPNYLSLDYYPTKQGTNRFEIGSVEGAPIYAITMADGSISLGEGGGYGRYANSLNPEGQVVFRVGHADKTLPVGGNITIPQISKTKESEPERDYFMEGFNEAQAFQDALTANNSSSDIGRELLTNVLSAYGNLI